MNIAIIDDELHSVESLLLDINTLFPHFNVVYKGTKPKAALDILKKIKVDLVFLDVEMPEMNGFEFLDQFDELPFDVIFTTAYSQYAIQAFKVQAINYILKPVDEEELKQAISTWMDKKAQNDASDEMGSLLDALKKEGVLTNKIAIPVAEGLEFLEVKKIMYCQSQSNYSLICLADGRQILISKTLKEVEKALQSFFFIRPSQSFLVNPNYLQKYIRRDGGYLLMDNGLQIPVSHTKKELIGNIFKTVERQNEGKP